MFGQQQTTRVFIDQVHGLAPLEQLEETDDVSRVPILPFVFDELEVEGKDDQSPRKVVNAVRKGLQIIVLSFIFSCHSFGCPFAPAMQVDLSHGLVHRNCFFPQKLRQSALYEQQLEGHLEEPILSLHPSHSIEVTLPRWRVYVRYVVLVAMDGDFTALVSNAGGIVGGKEDVERC